MEDQQILGIRRSLENLIPNSSVEVYYTSYNEIRNLISPKANTTIPIYGSYSSHHNAQFWFPLSSGKYCLLTLERRFWPLSKSEQTILNHFSNAMKGIIVSHEDRGCRAAARMASLLSFEDILVTRYLRKVKNTTTFWTPGFILMLLRELVVFRYEGNRCTSGFLFVSQPTKYLTNFRQHNYVFDSFFKPIIPDDTFFSSPASYRYVDGRNTFYVIDNKQKIHGIVRCKEPAKFSITQRANNEHIEPLLNSSAPRLWLAYIGDNDDINIVSSTKSVLKRSRNHWRFIDFDIVRDIIVEHAHLSNELATIMISTLLTISNLRLGTLLLIPNDDKALPIIAGKIDKSRLGHELYSQIVGKSIKVMLAMNSLIGVLTSDGLTTISQSGVLLRCGDIINNSTTSISNISGGGRTQAALAVSKFGLAIKVSEDGPISFYINEKQVFKIVV